MNASISKFTGFCRNCGFMHNSTCNPSAANSFKTLNAGVHHIRYELYGFFRYYEMETKTKMRKLIKEI